MSTDNPSATRDRYTLHEGFIFDQGGKYVRLGDVVDMLNALQSHVAPREAPFTYVADLRLAAQDGGEHAELMSNVADLVEDLWQDTVRLHREKMDALIGPDGFPRSSTRDSVIEECARLCDKEHERLNICPLLRNSAFVASDLAVLIRALKGKAPVSAIAPSQWHYGKPKRDEKDCRRLVSMEQHGMQWIGIRAWNHDRQCWMDGSGSEPEQATVVAWQWLPEPAWLQGSGEATERGGAK